MQNMQNNKKTYIKVHNKSCRTFRFDRQKKTSHKDLESIKIITVSWTNDRLSPKRIKLIKMYYII